MEIAREALDSGLAEVIPLPIHRTRPSSLLGRVLRNKGQRCYLGYDGCRKFADSVEHVIPKSRWLRDDAGNYVVSPDVMWNLKPACKPCNVRKGDKMPAGVEFQFGSIAWTIHRKDVRFQPCGAFRGWYCSHTECAERTKGSGLALGNTWGTIREETETQEPIPPLQVIAV